jgi:hypothetical protein
LGASPAADLTTGEFPGTKIELMKVKPLALILSCLAGITAHGQNILQFTGVKATSENAILLSWASNSNEVYEIDYADSLIDTNTGTIT